MGDSQEQLVMTPRGKTANSTTLWLERRQVSVTQDMHVAGGDHQGLIVNKQTVVESNNDYQPPELSLEFKVFLVNHKTNGHTQESRTLSYWFRNHVTEREKPRIAQDFFKELVTPAEFPRDYVGFIKKIMKLLQHRYIEILKMEIVLKQLQDVDEMPCRPRPGCMLITLHTARSFTANLDDSNEAKAELTEQRVLEIIESSFPNPITMDSIAKQTQNDDSLVEEYLNDLTDKGLIRALDNGAYTRVQQDDLDIKVVKQMPKMMSSKQPTIAIITAQYCEKLAVDAMIENKETFVRFTTVGESNVYTIGNIGAHRVVATKLPTVGHTRAAMIAAGNTTTRLLGTFQKVEFVFLVGVGGGVPHYTDYRRHVRLGDVVCSTPVKNHPQVYMFFDRIQEEDIDSGREAKFEIRMWKPPDLLIQDLALQLVSQFESCSHESPWMKYIQDGEHILKQTETEFSRPAADTDKLYMGIGGSDVIEVAHPAVPTSEDWSEGIPRLHLGIVASGRFVSRDDRFRQQIAAEYSISAFDGEFDAVLESIHGNRKDSFVIVRGISDYRDGTRGKTWQPYAALAAASFMKTLIELMPPMEE